MVKEQKFEKIVEGDSTLSFIIWFSFISGIIVVNSSFVLNSVFCGILGGFLIGYGFCASIVYYDTRKVYWRKIK